MEKILWVRRRKEATLSNVHNPSTRMGNMEVVDRLEKVWI